jgi:hypothetical protein
MTQISARGDNYLISGVYVPTLADYTKLRNDVQQLALDVAKIQDALNALLQNLRN